MDFTEFGGKNYLIVVYVDYYSRWLEVFQVKNKDSEVVINCCKELFSRFGIPEDIVADNNPFGSYAFGKFAEKWGFKVTTSSPYFHQSNGLAEKFVGIFKNMLRKCNEDQGDLNLYLLNYRNSPIAGLTYSPAQLMFCKSLRSKFPCNTDDLTPQIIDNPLKEMKENQIIQANNYNKTT
jgi:Integrase core domain.